MSLLENRNLILRTTDISFSNNPVDYFNTTVSSDAGSVSQNRQSTQWTNINLRTLMGNEFYNRYSQFELKLVKLTIGQTTAGLMTDTTTDMATRKVYLSGLPGVSDVLLTTVTVNLPTTSAGIGPTTVQSGSSSTVFNKPIGETASITINVKLNSTNDFYQPAASNLLYGHSQFLFEIYGVV